MLALALAVLASAAPAEARGKQRKRRPRYNPRVEHPAEAATSPAVRYGSMTPEACLRELDARTIPFIPEAADGVGIPVRLTGPLRGVTFRSGASDERRATTPHEIADCRLVLALDDFAALLVRHDVVEVIHYSMYRRPRSSSAREQKSQHAGALAIDAARFVRSDGSVLSVLDDFHGRIGARPTCGPRARPRRPTAETTALRAILCEAVDARIFHIALTPNFNRPHRNHFHLELNPGALWFLTH